MVVELKRCIVTCHMNGKNQDIELMPTAVNRILSVHFNKYWKDKEMIKSFEEL